jgi:hypothetical protein
MLANVLVYNTVAPTFRPLSSISIGEAFYFEIIVHRRHFFNSVYFELTLQERKLDPDCELAPIVSFDPKPRSFSSTKRFPFLFPIHATLT